MATIDSPFETDEVVGVVPAERISALLAVLQTSGLETDLLHGDEGADRLAAEIDGDGVLASIMRFFQQGEELDALRDFQGRLEQGDAVVRVLEVGDRAEEVARTVVEHGGETVWHFGEWTYRKMHR